MYIIGLTGGIASGKSTVSAILENLGAYIVDADAIARTVVMPNEPAWRDIVAHFGEDILFADGGINRVALGEKIFKDKEQRQCLENITHPYIKAQVEKRIAQAALSGVNVVVLDVPLLFEVGWQKNVDAIWVVYVREEVQVSRLIARNHLTIEQAQERIASQMSLGEKVKRADVLIDNNFDIEYTKEQVWIAWKNLQ